MIVMAESAIAQYRKKRIIVYNDDGTINLALTARGGQRILEAMEKVSEILRDLPSKNGIIVSSEICNIKCHASESTVLWDGISCEQRGRIVLTIQFAYHASMGCFPVKVITATGKEIFMGRKWPALTKYLNDFLGGP